MVRVRESMYRATIGLIALGNWITPSIKGDQLGSHQQIVESDAKNVHARSHDAEAGQVYIGLRSIHGQVARVQISNSFQGSKGTPVYKSFYRRMANVVTCAMMIYIDDSQSAFDVSATSASRQVVAIARGIGAPCTRESIIS